MKKLKPLYALIGAGLLIALQLMACSQSKQKESYANPPGYHLNKPIKWTMPEDLLEISGIAFNNGNADTVYAEQDEDGKVYYFHPGDKHIEHTKFAKQGDYEDIAILSRQIFILKSNGKLYRFPLDGIRRQKPVNVKEFKNILPEGEYEGLYADPSANQLLVLCKNCSVEKNSESNTVYLFSIKGDTLQAAGQAALDVRRITRMAGKSKIKFKPSALAKSPVSGQWFVLSSFNKLLVVANAQWAVTAVYHLNPGVFLQPEGIAFDKAGNLYISNEGDELSPGNVLMFPLSKKQ